MTRTRRFVPFASAAVLALVLSACGSDGGDSAAPAPDATDGALPTLTEGKLTIATGEPAYSPWVENDAPESGEGFEAAVAYAVAEELGFAAEDVVWVRTPFDTVIAPGPKDFDLNLQQFSITDQRAQVVDFSSPYYETAAALVSIEGNEGADATSIADLQGALIGAAVGTTTYQVVDRLVDTDEDIRVFNSNEDAVQALNSGAIDVLAVDLPTALYLAAVELTDGVVVGQLESEEGADRFGILLEKDSPLTDAVTAAVDALREDGTLAELEETWLTDAAGAPVLR